VKRARVDTSGLNTATGVKEESHTPDIPPTAASTPVEEAQQAGKLNNQNDDSEDHYPGGGEAASSPEQIEEAKEESEEESPEPPPSIPWQNRTFYLNDRDKRELANRDPWQTIPEGSFTPLKTALYKYPLSNIEDSSFRYLFRRKIQIALLQLSRIFLGTQFPLSEVKSYCIDITPARLDTYEAGEHIKLIHQVRQFINYEHTDPVRVFTLFSEFIAKHLASFPRTFKYERVGEPEDRNFSGRPLAISI